MIRRGVVVGAAGLVVVAGLAAAGHWRDGRIAECGRRSASLATLDLLDRQPPGFRPGTPYAGCDPDRVVAVASRQFLATGGPGVDQLAGRAATPVDQPAVIAFYRQALEGARWQIITRKPTPGPDAAALCATGRMDFGKAHISLSFPAAGLYEVAVSDTADPGARCT